MSELIARLMAAIETPDDLTQDEIRWLLEDAHIALQASKNRPRRRLEVSDLTSEQVDAITYAYLDVCATDKVVNDYSWDHRAISEIGEAVVQTKADLEKAFPFLIKGLEDE